MQRGSARRARCAPALVLAATLAYVWMAARWMLTWLHGHRRSGGRSQCVRVRSLPSPPQATTSAASTETQRRLQYDGDDAAAMPLHIVQCMPSSAAPRRCSSDDEVTNDATVRHRNWHPVDGGVATTAAEARRACPDDCGVSSKTTSTRTPWTSATPASRWQPQTTTQSTTSGCSCSSSSSNSIDSVTTARRLHRQRRRRQRQRRLPDERRRVEHAMHAR